MEEMKNCTENEDAEKDIDEDEDKRNEIIYLFIRMMNAYDQYYELRDLLLTKIGADSSILSKITPKFIEHTSEYTKLVIEELFDEDVFR